MSGHKQKFHYLFGHSTVMVALKKFLFGMEIVLSLLNRSKATVTAILPEKCLDTHGVVFIPSKDHIKWHVKENSSS